MFLHAFLRAGALGCRRIEIQVRLCFICLVLSITTSSMLAQTTSSVTLAWNPSTGSNIAGYRLYQGVLSGVYTNIMDVGNVTNATVRALAGGVTYYFAVTAYDTIGLESTYSTEVSYRPPVVTPPVITLSSPASGASFTAPALINISASVVANGHTITKVQFYSGATVVGESLAAPYTYSWSGVSSGTYTLKAAAVYDSGNSVTSAPVTITVTVPASLPPSIALTSPANNSAYLAPANFTMAAAVNPNGHIITKVQFFNGATLLGESATTPYNYAMNNLGAGSYTLSATAVYDQGSTVTSAGANVAVTNNPNVSTAVLPPPWQTADIGVPAVSGASSVTNGVYVVTGAGSLGASDQFRFLYQPMTGKGEIRARIRSEQNTGTSARGGVMIRETLAPGSEYVFIGMTPDGTFFTHTRTVTSIAPSAVSVGSAATPNAWVRLVRSGSTFYSYTSLDGVSWRLVNSAKFSMANAIYFGFAVESGSSTALNTTVFDNATIIP